MPQVIAAIQLSLMPHTWMDGSRAYPKARIWPATSSNFSFLRMERRIAVNSGLTRNLL